jgi:hypothetical protein
MAIKTKSRDPHKTDFSKEDLVINTKTGDLFYKSEQGLHKLEGNQTTSTSTSTTNFLYKRFSADWASVQSENGIPWAGGAELGYIRYVNVFVTPHDGTIHKLYWKQTGLCSDITVKVYIDSANTFDEASNFSGVTGAALNQTLSSADVNVGTGDGNNYSNLNTLPINLNFNAGDSFIITLKANTAQGIHEISGHLQYSYQNITT